MSNKRSRDFYKLIDIKVKKKYTERETERKVRDRKRGSDREREGKIKWTN